MTVARPRLFNAPSKIAFNSRFDVQVSLPAGLRGNTVQGEIPQSEGIVLVTHVILIHSRAHGFGILFACIPLQPTFGIHGRTVERGPHATDHNQSTK